MTENKRGLSDQIRAIASEKYVRAARGGGQTNFSIRVKDVLEDLRAEGFPENHIPQICTALQGRKFQMENGLTIKDVQGPPSKMSTTVVITYDVQSRNGAADVHSVKMKSKTSIETPKERIRRLASRLHGLLKDEFAEFGGGEAYLRWVRGYDEAE
jgi:hypothetical protein